MKVIEHIKEARKTLISFEILPPLKGKTIDSIYAQLDPLMEFDPSFINVTYHRSEQIYKKRPDGSFERIEVRKRPGTVGICAAIMNHYKIDAVPHLICGGFSKQETENALIDLNFLGIDNVLALRGDAVKGERVFKAETDGHTHAIELLRQIIELNKGVYLEDDIIDGYKTSFCIGVAGYPEKHFESPNLKSDLHYLKMKVDEGAGYITTQMFFDNKKYFDFVDRCRAEGINVPIIPGLKPLTRQSQLSSLPRTFNVDIPTLLSDEIMKCRNKADVERVGAEWLYEQSKELREHGVPVLHYYTLGRPDVVAHVVRRLL